MASWLELYSSSSLFQTISLGFVLDEPFFGPEFCKRLIESDILTDSHWVLLFEVLNRLHKAVLGIVPFRRTLHHLCPYTFKQGRKTDPAAGNAGDLVAGTASATAAKPPALPTAAFFIPFCGAVRP